jgi:hypothetical protein
MDIFQFLTSIREQAAAKKARLLQDIQGPVSPHVRDYFLQRVLDTSYLKQVAESEQEEQAAIHLLQILAGEGEKDFFRVAQTDTFFSLSLETPSSLQEKGTFYIRVSFLLSEITKAKTLEEIKKYKESQNS